VKATGFVTALVFAALSFAAAQNTGDPAAVSNILALEHAWDQAQERGDVKALTAIFDNSLVYVDFDGQILTKAGYLERVKSNSTHMQQIISEQMSVQIFGETAIVLGSYREKGVEKGRPYLHRGRFTDTWVLISGHWMCVAAGTTPILH
jgi:ketosteroid isomerase-like protein